MKSSPLPSKTDLLYEIAYNPKFVLQQSPRVSVKRVTEGQTPYLMRNQNTGQYFDLDEGSKLVWDLVDGKRAVSQIAKESVASRKFDETDTVIQTLLFFAESETLLSRQEALRAQRVRVVSTFEVDVTLLKESARLLKSVHSKLTPILKPSLFWAGMILVFAGAVIFSPRFSSTFNNAANFQILGSTVVGFLFYQFVVLLPVIAIHELSHGIALVHYGGQAREIGTGLFYFGPMFYVDATDAWNLSRRQRIKIQWAGNFSTVLIGSVLVFVRLIFPFPAGTGVVVDMAAFWCFYSTLWQLAPPFETDGYYMLSDVLNMPTLKSDSFTYLKSLVLRFLHRPSREPDDLTARKKRIFIGYGVFSMAFIGYLVYQSARVTIYMAGDAASWATKIWTSSSAGLPLSLLGYGVGVTSMVYFALTLSGYGVVVGKQLKKTLAGTVRFEVLHDRELAVFFYIPDQTPAQVSNRLEASVRSLARKMTPNSSTFRMGSLLCANLRMGGTTLPLSEIKRHLRRIEESFDKPYWNFAKATMKNLTRIPGDNKTFGKLLNEMVGLTATTEKRQAKGVLREFLRRQETTLNYIMNSARGSVWTIEIPPAQQYELVQNLIPSLLLEDLTMTNLIGEIEEFKKQTVYGLDTIAELAGKGASDLSDALSDPGRNQMIAFFEPIRGRIILTGRTERVENDIRNLGSLFVVQAWTGYVDNLLADTNLRLYSIAQSVSQIPTDINELRDGEIMVLDRFVQTVKQIEGLIPPILSESQEDMTACRAILKRLRVMFEPSKKLTVAQFDSILALNHENLQSIPDRLRELGSLSKKNLRWLDALEKTVKEERETREGSVVISMKRLRWLYSILFGLSIVSVALGVVEPGLLTPFFGLALALLSATLGTYFFRSRSTGRIPRYRSTIFNQALTSAYALTQALYSLNSGMRVLRPSKIVTLGGAETEIVRDERKERPEQDAALVA